MSQAAALARLFCECREGNITHQTAQGLVQRMAEKGLLKVSPSINDARYKQIFLTEKAQSIYRNMLEKGARTG